MGMCSTVAAVAVQSSHPARKATCATRASQACSNSCTFGAALALAPCRIAVQFTVRAWPDMEMLTTPHPKDANSRDSTNSSTTQSSPCVIFQISRNRRCEVRTALDPSRFDTHRCILRNKEAWRRWNSYGESSINSISPVVFPEAAWWSCWACLAETLLQRGRCKLHNA